MYKFLLGLLLASGVVYGTTEWGNLDILGYLTVDNVKVENNTISSTDTNGNIELAPNGSGIVDVQSEMSVGSDDSDINITLGGTTLQSILEVHSEGGTDLAGLHVSRHANGAAVGGHLLSTKSRGTHASPTVVQDGDVLSRYLSAGYDGTDYEPGAEIRTEVDGTPGNNDMPGALSFRTTADGAATTTERMRISQNGNVGIGGEASSNSILDVISTTRPSRPCPSMTEAQRDATTPDTGACIYNTDTNQLNQYNGSAWGVVAGDGGSGSKTYIQSDSSDFETGLGDWETFNDGESYTFTASGTTVDTGTDRIDVGGTGDSFYDGQKVTYTTTGTAIGGLTSGTDYYIVRDGGTFGLATSRNNAFSDTAIDLTSTGSGDQTFTGAEVYSGDYFQIATSDLTLATTDTANEVLAGDQSAKLTKPASNVQYQGVAVSTITIDREDRGKVLSGKISIDASNVATGDLALFAYDVTNNRKLLLQSLFSEDNEIPAQNDVYGFTVHTESTTEEIRFILGFISTSTSGYDVFFDSVTLGPQGFYPGENTLIQVGSLSVGTKNNGSYTTDSLAGMSFSGDDSLITITSGEIEVLQDDVEVFISYGGSADGSVENNAVRILYDDTSAATTNNRLAGSVSGTTTVLDVSTSGKIVLDDGDKIRVQSYLSFAGLTARVIAKKKISNLMSTTEAFFKNSGARYTRGTAQTIVNNDSNQIIDFNTEDFDEANLVTTGSSWKYTVQKSGKHLVGAFVSLVSSGAWNSTGEQAQLRLYITNSSGTSFITLDKKTPDATGIDQAVSLGRTILLKLNKDDELQFRVFQDSGANIDLDGDSRLNYAAIAPYPDLTTYGVYPENKVYEANISSLTTVSSDDTWTDITGSSITLPKGKYDLNYIIGVSMSGTQGDGRYSNVGIFDSDNNLIGAITLNHMESNRGKTHTATLFGKVFSEETTLKLRARKTGGTDAFFAGDSYTSGFTDPDVSLIFQAIRR